MAIIKPPKPPALAGLQNALGDNIALGQRATQNASSYYDDQLAKSADNPLAYGENLRQRAIATLPGDPQGMRSYTEALKERGAVTGRGLDLPMSPMHSPSTLFDPSQTTAVQPSMLSGGLAGLSRLLKGKKVQS